MEEVEEYSGATTELEEGEERNDEEEVIQPMGNMEEVEKTQEVEKEAGQKDVALEAEKTGETVEVATPVAEPSTEEMGEKMDEEMEMEKDPAAEEQGVEKEKVEKEQVTGPTEEPEKAETTKAEPEEVVKKPEVVQIEDDEVHMVTLQEVLATTVPTLSKRTVKYDEEDTQQRMPKRNMRLLMDEPEETKKDDDEEERMQMENKRKGKELAGPVQKKTTPASQTVTIRESSAERREDEALAWGRRLKRREDRR